MKRYKKLLKRVVLGAGIAFSVILISRFCHRQTAGFCLTKIQGNISPTKEIASTIAEDQLLVEALSHQKFHYLSRGLQSFVFLAEDGKTVLKLFNNRYQKKIKFLNILSYLPFLHSWAQTRRCYFHEKIAKTFESYRIAKDEMKEHTALLYAHLEPTQDLPKPLMIVDKLNILHEINPNRLGFVLQKKVELFYPTLSTCISEGKFNEAKQAIRSIIELFVWKCEHGIADNDPLIRTNYGFFERAPIQIDIGPLSKNPSIENPKIFRPKIRRIMRSLKKWLNENSPELALFLDQELQERLSSVE